MKYFNSVLVGQAVCNALLQPVIGGKPTDVSLPVPHLTDTYATQRPAKKDEVREIDGERPAVRD